MIVVAIIGILAAIALPAYQNYVQRSADSACLAEASAYAKTALADALDPNAPAVAAATNVSACTALDASGAVDPLGTFTATPVGGTGVDVTCDLAAGATCSLL
jgi:type IV pilus assembly protein PilA